MIKKFEAESKYKSYDADGDGVVSDEELARAKEFTDILLGDPDNPDLVAHPKLQDFSDRMFNTINEIQLATGRGSDTTFDKLISKAEDFTQLLNRPNRWQDFMLRRATFFPFTICLISGSAPKRPINNTLFKLPAIIISYFKFL